MGFPFEGSEKVLEDVGSRSTLVGSNHNGVSDRDILACFPALGDGVEGESSRRHVIVHGTIEPVGTLLGVRKQKKLFVFKLLEFGVLGIGTMGSDLTGFKGFLLA